MIFSSLLCLCLLLLIFIISYSFQVFKYNIDIKNHGYLKQTKRRLLLQLNHINNDDIDDEFDERFSLEANEDGKPDLNDFEDLEDFDLSNLLKVYNNDNENEDTNKDNPTVNLDLEIDPMIQKNDPEYETKKEALELLDYMTCPADEDDPAYDVEKDTARDDVLLMNDYEDLKIELRTRGLPTGGDKTEMIIRILLHIIDPTMTFDQKTGLETNLQYINKDDIASGNVTVVPEAERPRLNMGNMNPDADDLIVLKNDNKHNKNKGDKLVLDGLTRREIQITPKEITRDRDTTSLEDKDRTIRAYVVGGRDVLKSWEYASTAIVMIPDEYGWRDCKNRVFADELAFFNQAIVIVPDIYAGYSIHNEGKCADDSDSTIKEVVDVREKRCTTTSDWYAHLSSRRETQRMTDDLVSTLYYAHREYDPQALCIAGVGYGGGRALSAAAFLSKCSSVIQKSGSRAGSSIGSNTDSTLGSQEVLRQPHESEAVRDELLDAERIAAVNQAGLVSEDCSISMQTLLNLLPKAIYATTPSHFDISEVGRNIECACFTAFSDLCDPLIPCSGYEAAASLYDELSKRKDEVVDFGVRVYGGRAGNFAHRPVSDEDVKCAQEAMGIGAIWLDIYSRHNENDATIGMGTNKDSESAFVKIPVESLINPLRGSVIAAHLHDDPDFVRNLRLESDEQVRSRANEILKKTTSDGDNNHNSDLGKSILDSN